MYGGVEDVRMGGERRFIRDRATAPLVRLMGLFGVPPLPDAE